METISSSSGITGAVESLIGGRQENQDSYGMSETRLGLLVAVCDGMGGGPAGKTASTIATQTIIDYVSSASPEQNPLSVLADAVIAANQAILTAVSHQPELKGMGTTCVCVLLTQKTAYIVHVGDSRCYQIRGSKMVFRTADHSYVGELVKRGTLTEEEARNSKYSNVITRAIGAAPDIDPEVEEVSFKPGDRFALMSDGIWGSMPEPNLVKLLAEKMPPAELVPEIAAHVDALGNNKGGGHDNLTIAMVDIPGKRMSVTDAAASARPTRRVTPRVTRRISQDSDDTYQLEEMQEEMHRDVVNNDSRRSLLTWILSGALIVCVAVIIILLVWPHKAEEPKAKADSTKIDSASEDYLKQVLQNQAMNSNDSIAPDPTLTKQPGSSSPKSNSNSTNSTYDYANDVLEIENTVNQTEDTKDTVKKAIPKYQSQVAPDVARYLNNALDGIVKLRDFDPREVKDFAKVVEIRRKMFNAISTDMQKAINACKDITIKDKLTSLKSFLTTNENKIVRPDNGEWHKTTSEGLDKIDEFIKYLHDFI